MANNNTITIKVEGDVKDYVNKLKSAESSTSSFLDSIPGPATLAAGAIAAVVATITKGILEFNEAEQAVKGLNQAMVNAGTFSGELQQQYLNLAGELQKVTKFSDDQTISAISIIQAHAGAIEVTEDLVKATMNLATAKKMDLAQAAELIGKTIDGETNMLKRQGIEITNSVDSHERMASVIDKINGKWGDYAEAAGKGSGQLTIFKNATSDFLEAIGEKFAPIVNEAAGALARLIAKGTEYISSNSLNMKSEEEWQKSLQQQRIKIQEVIEKIDEYKKAGLATGFEEGLLKARQAEYEKLKEAHNTYIEDVEEADDNARINKADKDAETAFKTLEQQLAARDAANTMLGKKDEERALAQIEYEMKLVDQYLAVETDKQKRLQAIKVKSALQDTKDKQLKQKEDDDFLKQDLAKTVSMAQSKNALISTIGKAASIRQIWIDTPKNANAAYGAMVGIPIVGPALATLAQVAAYAFGAEQAAKVMSANKGGIVTGGIPGIDSVNALLTPGELVVPQKNYEEVVGAVARERNDEGGSAHVVLTMKDGLMDFIEAKLVERRALRLSVDGGV